MENGTVRIAIPLAENRLAQHFGHCEQFVLYDVDMEKKEVKETTRVVPPPHEPGILPPWLASQGVGVIITGGMGQRALMLFKQQGITVLMGALSEDPLAVVRKYLNKSLVTGQNVCDHGEHSCGH